MASKGRRPVLRIWSSQNVLKPPADCIASRGSSPWKDAIPLTALHYIPHGKRTKTALQCCSCGKRGPRQRTAAFYAVWVSGFGAEGFNDAFPETRSKIAKKSKFPRSRRLYLNAYSSKYVCKYFLLTLW